MAQNANFAIQARNEVILNAAKTVTNNADIKAGDIIIDAENFVSQAAPMVATIDASGNVKYVASATPKINADNNLIINAKENITSQRTEMTANNMNLVAGKDVNLIGSKLAAGDTLQVSAGNNLNITTNQETVSQNFTTSGANWTDNKTLTAQVNTDFSSVSGNNV